MNQTLQVGGGGWIASGTTGNNYPAVSRGLSAIIASALLVGTGGHMTVDYVVERQDRGYRFNEFGRIDLHQAIVERTPVENLSYIRVVLKPSVTDLARLFGVSRQSVYDWQNGTKPSPDHIARLQDIAKAATVFAVEGSTASAQLLRRPVAGGKTLFDIIREGGSAEDAARALVQMNRREKTQRETLQTRLAGRRPRTDAEYGIPMLGESV
jgi:hypothetical protein